MDGKRFVIGDIHGCNGHLKIMLSLLGRLVRPEDRVIFLGDYIDRGPDSRAVVDLLLEFSRDRDCVFLKGNHDARFVGWREKTATLHEGGIHTINSYKVDGVVQVPEEHLDFFRNLLPFHEEEDFLCVHAGFDPNKGPPTSQPEQILLNIREKFFYADKRWDKLIVFGHSPGLNAYSTVMPYDMVQSNNILGIDTGAVFDGRLTCYEIRSREFHQVFMVNKQWKIVKFKLGDFR